MEHKEKNTIYSVILIVVGIIIILYTIYPVLSLLTELTNGFGPLSLLFLYLGLLISGIASILTGYFILKPRKTSQGRKKLAITSIIIGIILIFFALMFIILYVARIMIEWDWTYLASPWTMLLAMSPFLALLIIPGLALVIHGIHLLRNPQLIKREDVINTNKNKD